MEFGANINTLLLLTGLSTGAAAILLAINLAQVRKPYILRNAIAPMIFLTMLLLILALFLEQTPVSYFSFILFTLPLFLPVPLLLWAEVTVAPVVPPEPETERKAIPSRSAQAEFNEQLTQIPRILASHPQGLTLVEIGEKMGVEWRRLTGAARELLERGRIEKEEKKYFLSRRGS